MPATDSFVGEGLAPSPYKEAIAEIVRLRAVIAEMEQDPSRGHMRTQVRAMRAQRDTLADALREVMEAEYAYECDYLHKQRMLDAYDGARAALAAVEREP